VGRPLRARGGGVALSRIGGRQTHRCSRGEEGPPHLPPARGACAEEHAWPPYWLGRCQTQGNDERLRLHHHRGGQGGTTRLHGQCPARRAHRHRRCDRTRCIRSAVRCREQGVEDVSFAGRWRQPADGPVRASGCAAIQRLWSAAALDAGGVCTGLARRCELNGEENCRGGGLAGLAAA